MKGASEARDFCRNASTAAGFTLEDMYGFSTAVPAGRYAFAYWQAKGYARNPAGATMPTSSVSEIPGRRYQEEMIATRKREALSAKCAQE